MRLMGWTFGSHGLGASLQWCVCVCVLLPGRMQGEDSGVSKRFSWAEVIGLSSV